jgi:hypothetical protein
MTDKEIQDLFKRRNTMQAVIIDTVQAIGAEDAVDDIAVEALKKYLDSYIDNSNYLIEHLMREVTMAEARIEELIEGR